jgi:hypothetical protein
MAESKRKFYRTVLQLVILSEEPYEETDLTRIAEDITDGPCSGLLTDISRNEVTPAKHMVVFLKEQGSDPEFFQLNSDGEDTEEVDEE